MGRIKRNYGKSNNNGKSWEIMGDYGRSGYIIGNYKNIENYMKVMGKYRKMTGSYGK